MDGNPRPTPDLAAGVTRLALPADAAGLYRVVVDHLAAHGGPALWVDARNHASTYALYDAADADRRLRELRIARAFTAYQHHELVRRTVRRADAATSLVVVPEVAALYRDDDVPGGEARAMLRSTAATLSELASACDLPVVVTDSGPDDRLAGVVADAVDREVACERTRAGLRFDGPDFETTTYRRHGWWQTTIPYWADLLGTVPAVETPAPTAPTLAEAY